MGFVEAVRSVYRNFFNFQGRARRSEYWWFFLFNILAGIVIGIVEVALGLGAGTMSSGPGEVSMNFAGGPLSIIWSLVNIIPGIAVGIRRLHDTDRSGWWTFIALIPLIGFILLIVWYASNGTAGSNRFGNDPKA
jgi:uncharacterized membrane protein YhaH (DUF805 family)